MSDEIKNYEGFPYFGIMFWCKKLHPCLVFVGQVCPTYKLQADLEREGVKVLSVKYCKYEFKIAKTKL